MAFCEAERSRFVELYEESKSRLAPLSDPLDTIFPLHRQLAPGREEVYSDWLQWVLGHIADPMLIWEILGCQGSQRVAGLVGKIEVEREVPVEHGHPNQTGRIDLNINCGGRCLAVIEVKTKPYSELNLAKHDGYRESEGTQGAELILLSINAPLSGAGGFRFLPWADLCMTLRRIAPDLLGRDQIVGTALVLAFVGAVEQNLLGFFSPTAIPFLVARVPRMVDHFTRVLEKDETLGKR